MSKFNELYRLFIEEIENSAATAMGGPNGMPAGSYGNQFPSQNDNAYNPGNGMPVAPAALALGKRVRTTKKSKKGKRSNKVDFPIQRRLPFGSL
jgi:hypothetical protein